MYNIIDLFQQTSDFYYIDYIPYETSDVRFLELERYFESNYLSIFAEKISRIALKLIYYYPCVIYLTESPIPSEMEYEISFNVNIRDNSPDKSGRV